MRLRDFAAGCAALAVIGAAGSASAQRSLFDQPAAQPAQPAQPAQAPAAAPAPGAEAPVRPKPKPRKPSGPVPARVITINNAGANTLEALVVSAEEKSAKLSRPLAPKKKTTLKLPAFKSCTVSVAATFQGQAATTSEVDICKEKTIRFTE